MDEPCHLHCLDAVPVLGAIGAVDRVDEQFGDHCVVVAFELWHQGTQWTDRFKPSGVLPA